MQAVIIGLHQLFIKPLPSLCAECVLNSYKQLARFKLGIYQIYLLPLKLGKLFYLCINGQLCVSELALFVQFRKSRFLTVYDLKYIVYFCEM